MIADTHVPAVPFSARAWCILTGTTERVMHATVDVCVIAQEARSGPGECCAKRCIGVNVGRHRLMALSIRNQHPRVL